MLSSERLPPPVYLLVALRQLYSSADSGFFDSDEEDESMPSQLWEPSDGIFGTIITWENVEERLRSSLKTQARLGAAREVALLGKGSVTKIALVKCDWTGAAKGEKLPEKVVIKLTSCVFFCEFTGRSAEQFPEPMRKHVEKFALSMHNSEMDFYRTLTAWKSEYPSLSTPECYYGYTLDAEESPTGHLALEFIDGCTVKLADENISVKQALQVAREIGRLQGIAHKKGEVLEKKYERKLLGDYWATQTIESFTATCMPVTTLDKHGQLGDVLDRVLALMPIYFGTNLSETLHVQRKTTPVLVHGDLWSANLLFDNKTEDLRMLIDWQLVRQGSPATDILRMALTSMSAADRRAHMQELLSAQYDAMMDVIGDGDAPYTMEELQEIYTILMPRSAFFVLPQIAGLAKSVREITHEELEMRNDAAIEKLKGALEDMLEFHELNAEANKNLKETF